MLRWYEELFLRTWAGVTCCGRRQACTQTTLSKYKDTLAIINSSYYCYCHLHRHHNLITITSNMWFPIYRIASHTTTRFRSLVLEQLLVQSSSNTLHCGRQIFGKWSNPCINLYGSYCDVGGESSLLKYIRLTSFSSSFPQSHIHACP